MKKQVLKILMVGMLFVAGCGTSSLQMSSTKSKYASEYIPKGDENNVYFNVQKYNYDMDQEFIKKQRPIILTYMVAIGVLFPYDYLQFRPIIYIPTLPK